MAWQRRPHNYNGTGLTTRQMGDLLTVALGDLQERQQERPDLILEAWSQVIGPKFSSMTQAVSFVKGILTIKVKNSTLYSLLNEHEKARLLQLLRKQFPKIEIKTIIFRMG